MAESSGEANAIFKKLPIAAVINNAISSYLYRSTTKA